MTQRLSTLLSTMTALLLLGTIAGRASAPQRTSDTPTAARVQHGEYLVNTMGCHDCHTPWAMGPNGPAPDMTRMLSGHPSQMVLPPAPGPSGQWIVHSAATNTAYAGPWGVSFTANLTPDNETGLGEWTEEMFLATIRTGRRQGKGRAILPPMPIPVYQHATDADLRDIFSYLQSIPAIRNKVPTPIDPDE